MGVIEFSKNKIKNILLVYAVIFIPIWAVFIVNNIAMNEYLSPLGGIIPRDISIGGFLAIFTSWMFHGTINGNAFTHIMGNCIALLGLLFVVGAIETKPLKLLTLLIAGSGTATWLLGAPGSMHVGASGLVFALFGYVISSVFLGRRWIYLFPIVLVGGDYFYSLKVGLIPQAGVSFSAHFGGFVAGILIGYYFNRVLHSQETQMTWGKKTFRQKVNTAIFDIKHYFKYTFFK